MRIQDTNDILNEARIQRLDANRHTVENRSMWDSMKSGFPNFFRRRDVQAGLITAGSAVVTAVVGMLVSPRARRGTFKTSSR